MIKEIVIIIIIIIIIVIINKLSHSVISVTPLESSSYYYCIFTGNTMLKNGNTKQTCAISYKCDIPATAVIKVWHKFST